MPAPVAAAAGGVGLRALLGGALRLGGRAVATKAVSGALSSSDSSNSSSPTSSVSTQPTPSNPGAHNWGNLGRVSCFLGGCGERS